VSWNFMCVCGRMYVACCRVSCTRNNNWFSFSVYLRCVGGEVGATSSLAPKIGPLGLVSNETCFAVYVLVHVLALDP
jgi:hypothetical protein